MKQIMNLHFRKKWSRKVQHFLEIIINFTYKECFASCICNVLLYDFVTQFYSIYIYCIV